MRTILIIDDEDALRQAYADYFEDRLWRPIQAESAEAALELLQTESPHIALVDIRLPGMDGNEFIRQALLLAPRMAYVICTGSHIYALPSDLQNIHQICPHTFRKPVPSIIELEKTLIHAIERVEKVGNE